jgi:hypothetical protein
VKRSADTVDLDLTCATGIIHGKRQHGRDSSFKHLEAFFSMSLESPCGEAAEVCWRPDIAWTGTGEYKDRLVGQA